MRIAKSYYDNKPLPERTAGARAAARAEAARRTKEAESAIATQKARLAALRPANDNVPRRFRGNARTLNWLAKRDPEAAWSVREYGRSLDVADTAEAAADEDSAGFVAEAIHGVRPTINEMLADLLRPRVVSFKGEILHRVDGLSTQPTFDGRTARLGGMRFNFHPDAERRGAGGTMVAYTNADGRECLPGYDTGKRRGAANEDTVAWTRTSGGKEGVKRPNATNNRDDLDEQHDVLEMVLAGMSLREIGQARGYGIHYADRGAAADVLRAAEWAKERFLPPQRLAA